MNTTTPHLTDDQFAERLSGLPSSPAVNAHLASCEQCRSEVGSFLETMDDFSTAAMGWSKAQPTPSLRAVVQDKPRRGFPRQAQWAMAAVLVVATGGAVAAYRENNAVTPEVAAAQHDADSATQIAQDNNLLQSVSVALNDNDPSPFREYGLPVPQTTRATGSAERRNQ